MACGGNGDREAPPPRVAGPRIERALADELAARSDEVARRLESGDPCGARVEADAMRNDLIAGINAQRVPRAYLEDLTAAVNELAEGIRCVAAPPPAPGDDDDEDDEGNGNGNGKAKGKGKDKDRGEEDRD